MYVVALVVSTVISVAYLAIFASITVHVLLVGDQWRHNPLAVATAGIFLSCGIGHGLHLGHLVEFGDRAPELFDTHMVLWDATTAAVATWYWSMRSRLSALSGTGELFQDAAAREQARLAGVLGELFDGVELVPASAAVLPTPLASCDTADALLAVVAATPVYGPQTLAVRVDDAVLEVRTSAWSDQVVLAWRDVTELQQVQRAYEERLRHLADHDPLTGLVNRRRFDEELGRQFGRRSRGHREGALLLLDLDRFKEVNDTLGHAVGDRLLVSLASLLRRHVRAQDVVSRLGGDEFAVLCTDATEDEALALAERLCAAVRQAGQSRGDRGGAPGRVTCSVGLTLVADHEDAEDALIAADLTLYAAKGAGRDRVTTCRSRVLDLRPRV